ncbi:MAG: hypothetical protein RLY97_1162 [Pseudomonadota bacterium]|jgi:hypothetical protein
MVESLGPLRIDREWRMVERCIRMAKFPQTKSFDTFDFVAQPPLNKALVILKSARIHGDVQYETLTIEQGARVDGRFVVRGAKVVSSGPAAVNGEPKLMLAKLVGFGRDAGKKIDDVVSIKPV